MDIGSNIRLHLTPERGVIELPTGERLEFQDRQAIYAIVREVDSRFGLSTEKFGEILYHVLKSDLPPGDRYSVAT